MPSIALTQVIYKSRAAQLLLSSTQDLQQWRKTKARPAVYREQRNRESTPFVAKLKGFGLQQWRKRAPDRACHYFVAGGRGVNAVLLVQLGHSAYPF